MTKCFGKCINCVLVVKMGKLSLKSTKLQNVRCMWLCFILCISANTRWTLQWVYCWPSYTDANKYFFFSLQHGNLIHLAQMESVSVQSASCFWFIKTKKASKFCAVCLIFCVSSGDCNITNSPKEPTSSSEQLQVKVHKVKLFKN